jgi:predicted metal-dependent hydrolase
VRYPCAVQLDLPFLRFEAEPRPIRPGPPPGRATIHFIREHRARKYIIRIKPDGSLRVTIPRGGSRRDAEAFVAKHRDWAEKERLRVAAQHAPVEWCAGDLILFRGQRVPLVVERDARGPVLVIAHQRVCVPEGSTNLRPAAEFALRHIAVRELVPRLRELADRYGLKVRRATIRNQRSRWGSCSRTGAIALNFRLVQMPPAICEYVMVHELMHIRQQNHSAKYWKLVEEVCPDYLAAERWLRTEGKSLF